MHPAFSRRCIPYATRQVPSTLRGTARHRRTANGFPAPKATAGAGRPATFVGSGERNGAQAAGALQVTANVVVAWRALCSTGLFTSLPASGMTPESTPGHLTGRPPIRPCLVYKRASARRRAEPCGGLATRPTNSKFPMSASEAGVGMSDTEHTISRFLLLRPGRGAPQAAREPERPAQGAERPGGDVAGARDPQLGREENHGRAGRGRAAEPADPVQAGRPHGRQRAGPPAAFTEGQPADSSGAYRCRPETDRPRCAGTSRHRTGIS